MLEKVSVSSEFPQVKVSVSSEFPQVAVSAYSRTVLTKKKLAENVSALHIVFN
jgi:hypothetical protein